LKTFFFLYIYFYFFHIMYFFFHFEGVNEYDAFTFH